MADDKPELEASSNPSDEDFVEVDAPRGAPGAREGGETPEATPGVLSARLVVDDAENDNASPPPPPSSSSSSSSASPSPTFPPSSEGDGAAQRVRGAENAPADQEEQLRQQHLQRQLAQVLQLQQEVRQARRPGGQGGEGGRGRGGGGGGGGDNNIVSNACRWLRSQALGAVTVTGSSMLFFPVPPIVAGAVGVGGACFALGSAHAVVKHELGGRGEGDGGGARPGDGGTGARPLTRSRPPDNSRMIAMKISKKIAAEIALVLVMSCLIHKGWVEHQRMEEEEKEKREGKRSSPPVASGAPTSR